MAILLVLLAHTTTLDGAGSVGVTLFFVLSGFLITSLLLEERERSGRTSLAGFYRRRFFRLGPALIVMLVGAALIQAYIQQLGITPGMLLTALGSVSNWWIVAGHSPLNGIGHTWSLGIEEQFYLLWPLVLVACSRWGRRGVAVAASVGIVVSTVCIVVPGGPDPYFGTVERFGALLLGCLLAVAMGAGAEGPSRPGVVTIALVALVPLFWLREDLSATVYLMVVPALSAAAIWGAAQGATVRWFSVPVLRWFGKRSYGIYLWHYPIVFAVSPHLGDGWLRGVVVVALSCGVAETSWRLVELPLQRWSKPRASGDARVATQELERHIVLDRGAV